MCLMIWASTLSTAQACTFLKHVRILHTPLEQKTSVLYNHFKQLLYSTGLVLLD